MKKTLFGLVDVDILRYNSAINSDFTWHSEAVRNTVIFHFDVMDNLDKYVSKEDLDIVNNL